MEYRLTAELVPPEGTPHLDELQRYGVAALLGEWLDRVATVEGPDGVEITPYDHEVDTRSERAVVRLLVDAPALEFAENGAAALLQEILERTEHMSGWRVGKCAVTVTDAELAEAVSGEETSGRVDAYAGQLAAGSEEPVPTEVRTEQRRRLLARAAELTAFSADVFRPGTAEAHVEDPTNSAAEPAEHRHDPQAAATEDTDRSEEAADYPEAAEDGNRTVVTSEDIRLAAGALIHCAGILTEELFADLSSLEEPDTFDEPVDVELTAADHEVMFVLHDLPVRYRHLYGSTFAKRFLVASVTVFTRLTDPAWQTPRCTAEALALHLLVENATTLLIGQAGVPAPVTRSMLAGFSAAAFVDRSHEALFWRGLDGTETGADAPGSAGEAEERVVHGWFQPYGEKPGHPYYDLGESG
ncbi:hypothetical protein RIF23_20165 [Lipingzhangella sp. LS1_29]|uniref:Uncharacterized protein n=1 Tax=Lipingzhangella rawalii TaxID=2055835 RepID=A0ABU2HB96_9ACTN|nr:hypothetical protein [Lipingzhangella rawalii]MDS1272606.1 hypothetical protein [Lipingzhangella rawalii]